MRIKRIDLEGNAGRYATITRKNGCPVVEALILTPDQPNGRGVHADAADDDELWTMAEALQRALDNVRGTNSMIHDYYRELQRIAE